MTHQKRTGPSETKNKHDETHYTQNNMESNSECDVAKSQKTHRNPTHELRNKPPSPNKQKQSTSVLRNQIPPRNKISVPESKKQKKMHYINPQMSLIQKTYAATTNYLTMQTYADMYIYIYIYMCVCVCARACENEENNPLG